MLKLCLLAFRPQTHSSYRFILSSKVGQSDSVMCDSDFRLKAIFLVRYQLEQGAVLSPVPLSDS